MPQAPSKLEWLPSAKSDLASIADHNPNHGERILEKIDDWERLIHWDRVPQEELEYLTAAGEYNFYRQRIGRSGYRVVYAISNDTMTVVAILPKDDDTYDVDSLSRRMHREGD